MTIKRNTEGLRQNAQKKRQEALEKVERGIRQLIKEGKPVNFNTVAQAADVSKAFLYKEAEVKERIEQLRQQGNKRKPELKQEASDASKEVMIRTLRERVKKLEAEIRDLRKQNEVAYGLVVEVHSLRQLNGRLQAENDELKKKMLSNDAIRLKPLNISDIEAEVRSLGVVLNTTISKLIQEAPPEATRRAVESLREAIAEQRVKNPTGFLNKAIRDSWKPNDDYEEQVERSLFNEWYGWAQGKGLVQAATLIEGVQHVLTTNGSWVSFSEMFEQNPLLPK